MDIANIVQYEEAFLVEIVNPGTRDPIGITINVISMESDTVVKKLREFDKRKIAEHRKAGTALEDIDFSDERAEVLLAACIHSWDFGGQSFGDLGVDPECTDAAKEYVVRHKNASWLRDQIAAGCAKLENFFTASEKPAKRTSKKA